MGIAMYKNYSMNAFFIVFIFIILLACNFGGCSTQIIDKNSCSNITASINLQSPPDIINIGSQTITVNTTICSDFVSGYVWLEITTPSGVTDQPNQEINSSYPSDQNFNFSYNFSQEGTYTVWAEATKKDNVPSNPDMHTPKYYITVISGTPRIIVWSGNLSTFNSNEVIGSLGGTPYYYAYPISIQVLDGNNKPINNVQINFTSSDPYLSVTTQATSYTMFGIDGLASPYSSGYTTSIGNEIKNVNITATATINAHNVSLIIPLKFQNDKESSGISGYHQQEDGSNNEILGDNCNASREKILLIKKDCGKNHS